MSPVVGQHGSRAADSHTDEHEDDVDASHRKGVLPVGPLPGALPPQRSKQVRLVRGHVQVALQRQVPASPEVSPWVLTLSPKQVHDQRAECLGTAHVWRSLERLRQCPVARREPLARRPTRSSTLRHAHICTPTNIVTRHLSLDSSADRAGHACQPISFQRGVRSEAQGSSGNPAAHSCLSASWREA